MASQDSNPRIVGIGASAGGIDSLKEFFDAMPGDSDLAFVVIQHLDPNQPSQMAALLAKFTGMRVATAEDGAAVRANHVYTIPPGKFIFTENGKLRLTEAVKRDGLRMPIDYFLRSLAADQREQAIAVLFSGSGSDGTLGIREIRGAAGFVVVQDPKTAQFDSMIQHALDTGMVDLALPVRQIPGAILQYARHSGAGESHLADSETTRDGIDSILRLLASQSKSDFRCYKPATIQRRIQRRMGLNDIHRIADYYRFLSDNPDEIAKLAQDMLIGVTSFFRDPQAFEELREKVVAPLVGEQNNADPLRIWVAGCATGEEAYSIVMVFMEEMSQARKSFRLQLFASDIDAEALKIAREGLYSQSITADVAEERLARFFIKQDGAYRIDKQVREAVTFAPHNVISDPPFFNLDLISCRNLLIYIEPEMQKKILSLFGFGLKPGGYLFLGKSENPLEQSEIFEPVSKSMRVFRRNLSRAAPVGQFESMRSAAPLVVHDDRRSRALNLADLNQQVLLKHFNASIVLTDENGEIRHFYGPTHRYLAHPSGEASLSLFEMVEKRHASELRLAIERAVRQNQAVRIEALAFGADGDSVNITITPILERGSGARLCAVIFEDSAKPVETAPAGAQPPESDRDTRVARLEAENKALRAELQAGSDGFQITHEELTAANEEVMAINEELQSTNEELVTSKEELQSLNEELVTTNHQLSDKIGELGKVNDDLANFLNSSEVGTIFLDRKFCIRRFTPATTQLINLLPQDLGRPVSHLSNKVIAADLTDIADSVLKTLIPVEKEILSTDKRWYMLRCLPYRTSDDVINGVVFTFTDVTRLKRSEEAMTEARDFAENIIQTTSSALVVLDHDLKVVSANSAFYETFQVSPAQTEGRLIYELGNRQWDIAGLRELLEQVLPKNSVVEDFEVKHDFSGIGPKIMSVNARRIYNRENKAVQFILLAIDDISDRRQIEDRRQEFSRELERKVSERTAELEQAHQALLQDIEQRNRLEDQLRQAQKLESVGTLAAGVAHDLNNILNIVQGYAAILASGADDGQLAESVQAITETTKRGAALVQQLLTLARKTETRLSSVDVNGLVRELVKLIKETFPKTIELSLELGRLPSIMADDSQITQVLLNLCVNARDAMPKGGRLALRTRLIHGEELDKPDGGDYVSIEVSDTGTGMDENVQSKIFEPFFTTKEVGQGTGLGLAVVYGIVKSHGGLIRIESQPMQGTTFHLHFPVVPAGG